MNNVNIITTQGSPQSNLFKVQYVGDKPTVLARDLHEFLEIETRFNDWFKRMCEYGFNENTDYIAITQKRVTAQRNETTYTDYQLTIEMAKEICMLQRSEKGKLARQYFIQLEKDWNSPEKVMYRAMEYARQQLDTFKLENSMLKQINCELQPKADYYDDILKNKGLVTTTQIAKDYGMSGTEMNKKLHELDIQYKQSGQWLLYAKHQDKGYTHSETINIKRSDGRPDVKMNTKWTQKGRLFLYEILKKNGIMPVIEKADGGIKS